MVDRGGDFSFFQRIHVRIVIRRTDISISIRPFDHQIWQAGISTRCDSNETNEAGTGGVIISSSRDKLKTLHLHYQMTTKLGKVTYLDGLLPIQSHDPLIICLVRSRDKLKPLYLHYHRAYL